jgi:hypothetical protein
MAKDIYLIMRKYALLSPRLSQGEAKKSSSKQGRCESEKQHKGAFCETKVDSIAQPAEQPVQTV